MCPSSSSREGRQGKGSHVYLLNCSVCKGEFSSRQKWAEHLTHDSHQNLARETLQNLRCCSNLRECSLVIFTTYDLTAEWAGKLIQYFGKDQSVCVTDFLWWEARPTFAIIEFESRKKVEQVMLELEAFSGDLIQIENQGIQVKRACDILDLEWKAILPWSNPAQKSGASLCEILQVDSISSGSSRKRGIGSLQNQPKEKFEGPWTNKKTKIIGEPVPCPKRITFDLGKLPLPTKGNETSLPHQLYKLLEETMVIPDNQFDSVLQAVNFLQSVFIQSYEPSCKVSLFRNWNLKLKTLQDDSEDMPLVYVYNRMPREETECGFTLLPSGKIWTILKSEEVEKKISVLEGPSPNDPCVFKRGWNLEWKGFGGDGKGNNTFKLCLFSSYKFLFEVEMGNLLEYMCKFDGRAYQMIKTAIFWMGVNKLSLGEVGEEEGGQSSLQWLVIFWMCNGNMVPSAKEIQRRGNRNVMRYGGTGVDLGWEEDKEFLEEWRENKKEFKWGQDWTLSLMEGFRDFLEFCGRLGEGSAESWVLNTRTGELIERKTLLDLDSFGDMDTKMSEEEMGLLRAQVDNFKDCMIYMTHPINLQWKFGLRSDIKFVLKLMWAGATKLKKYLNLRKFSGAKEAKKRFKSLRDIFNVTNVDSSEAGLIKR